MLPINWILKKKMIIFDTHKERLDDRFTKFPTFLYKKYITKKISKPRILELNNMGDIPEQLKKLNSTEYKIIESKLKEIKKEFNNKFIN